MAAGVHLNLDDAWEDTLDLPKVDAREWGPRLRFSAPLRVIEDFYRTFADRLAPFVIYGSGDFHHLSALWLRRFSEPLTVVSFDNHPDWDVRPPRWCCGGWVNRALDLSQVRKVSVWGCGNFEPWWPGQVFGNRRAERAGTLAVHAWADDRPLAQQARRGAIFRASWREDFERFAAGLKGGDVYVTVDMDCLRAGDAVTNWENGRFSADDVAWALEKLRSGTRIVGGDICGAYSPQKYARWKQRLVATFDHPRMKEPEAREALAINRAAFEKLWPVLAN